MKRDLVQLWVTKATRQAVKVQAAKAGLSAVDFLEGCFHVTGNTERVAEVLVTTSEKSPSV